MADCLDCGVKLARPTTKRCAACHARLTETLNGAKVVLLEAARSYLVKQNGREPSVRELAAELGWGVATVHSYLKQLEAASE